MALLERSILGFVLIARTCKELARVQLMLATMQCLKILKPKNNKKSMIQDDLVSRKNQHAVTYSRNGSADFEEVRSVC